MDNRIVAIENYWAAVVRNSGEFQQIATAENPEFNKLLECIKRILQDAFIYDATEYGVGRWENMLKIVPEINDDLETRKTRVLTYLSLQLPYTWRVLRQMLNSFVGENNFTMKFINDTSKLIIKVNIKNDSQYETIMTLLKNVVPQNIIVDLGYME